MSIDSLQATCHVLLAMPARSSPPSHLVLNMHIICVKAIAMAQADLVTAQQTLMGNTSSMQSQDCVMQLCVQLGRLCMWQLLVKDKAGWFAALVTCCQGCWLTSECATC